MSKETGFKAHSNAIKLAEKFGTPVLLNNMVCFYPAQIEAFYHAARAEALSEAADKLDEEIHDVTDPVGRLRAMADREGK